jgi:hypothetical protein
MVGESVRQEPDGFFVIKDGEGCLVEMTELAVPNSPMQSQQGHARKQDHAANE